VLHSSSSSSSSSKKAVLSRNARAFIAFVFIDGRWSGGLDDDEDDEEDAGRRGEAALVSLGRAAVWRRVA
jgi:hypothetical protein